MVYYAMAMSAGSIGGDRYISFSLSGLVEIPSLVIGCFIVDKYAQLSQLVLEALDMMEFIMHYRVGRRWTLGGFLLVGGISSLIWTQLQSKALIFLSLSLSLIHMLTHTHLSQHTQTVHR